MVLVLAAVLAFAGVALAQTQTFSSTVPQSGFADVISGGGAPLTGPPYAFGNEIQDCQSIESLTVTLTLFDGDTGGPLDTERDELTLGLDGIDTGILLNGFPDSERGTNTISGVPNNAAQILATLQADNQLEGSIFDRIPGEDFVRLPGDADTTLEITCATADQQPPPQAGAAPAPIEQDFDQEAEAGEVDQTFEIT